MFHCSRVACQCALPHSMWHLALHLHAAAGSWTPISWSSQHTVFVNSKGSLELLCTEWTGGCWLLHTMDLNIPHHHSVTLHGLHFCCSWSFHFSTISLTVDCIISGSEKRKSQTDLLQKESFYYNIMFELTEFCCMMHSFTKLVNTFDG